MGGVGALVSGERMWGAGELGGVGNGSGGAMVMSWEKAVLGVHV